MQDQGYPAPADNGSPHAPDPRGVITGVYTPTPLDELGRFDWYSATVAEDPGNLAAVVQSSLEAEANPVSGMHGYTSGFAFTKGGSTVARMLYGGPNGNPHVWASGDDTEELVELLRRRWPDRHVVTRADVALDFDEPGAWDSLYAIATSVVDERGLRQSQAGDWRALRDGRTYYVGSRRSAVFARLYEKGKQLAKGLPPGVPNPFSDDHVRLELQVRPEGDLRRFAARTEPIALYGAAEWARVLLERTTALAVERVHIKARRISDDRRAIHYAVRQYGEHLARLAEDLGGWEHVGSELARIRRSIEAQKGDR